MIRHFLTYHPDLSYHGGAPLLAARRNNLETLRFLCEELECQTNTDVITAAAKVGNLPMLEYALNKDRCYIYHFALEEAAKYNHLEVFKYLQKFVRYPPSQSVTHFVAHGNQPPYINTFPPACVKNTTIHCTTKVTGPHTNPAKLFVQ